MNSAHRGHQAEAAIAVARTRLSLHHVVAHQVFLRFGVGAIGTGHDTAAAWPVRVVTGSASAAEMTSSPEPSRSASSAEQHELHKALLAVGGNPDSRPLNCDIAGDAVSTAGRVSVATPMWRTPLTFRCLCGARSAVVTKYWHDVRAAAGLGTLRFHDLLVTSFALDVPPHVVREVAGHSDVSSR